MIRNREEFTDYLREWGVRNDRIDEIIELYFGRDRNYPIDEDCLNGWLEFMWNSWII